MYCKKRRRFKQKLHSICHFPIFLNLNKNCQRYCEIQFSKITYVWYPVIKNDVNLSIVFVF